MTGRISRDVMLMEMARIVAKRGTCSRLKVGAVISVEGRVVSMGYNGAPAGMPHCNHECNCDAAKSYLMAGEHPNWCNSMPSSCVAVHAEANAIAFAARHGLKTDGATMHCTDTPCLACAQLIVNAGIRQVWADRPYRLTEGTDLLRDAGVVLVILSEEDV